MGGTRLLGWLVGAAERESFDWDAVYQEELPRVYNFFRYRVGNPATAVRPPRSLTPRRRVRWY